MKNDYIEIKGAKVNNLKNIDVNIPLNNFIVITGVSGSGKSSLAFDTLYAEGQRRYVESLSAYARQFLNRLPKPDCDYIKNLPPAVAIEQKVISRNPRSTVGTSTEIYDYLKLLFARIGRTFSPISGEEVKKHGIEEIVNSVMAYPKGTRIAVLTDINLPSDRNIRQQLDIYQKEGFSRLERNGEFFDISELLENDKEINEKEYHLLIDRLIISDDKDEISRLTDSIETAYYEGNDKCIIKIWLEDGVKELSFSRLFQADGILFREPSELMFNFNNPYGACDKCEGFGKILGISESLVIPDPNLSIYQDAVQCWKGEKMSEWKKYFIKLSGRFKFPIHTPYKDLTKEEKELLWNGKDTWEGINGFFKWVDENQYKIQYRVLKARYRGKAVCPECHGNRLKKDAEYVKIGGYSISDLVKLPVTQLLPIMENLNMTDTEKKISERLLNEITNRLRFLEDVGLGYLTLDRLSSTLSGGESQRINLATSLGSSLVGSLYVLDEPSIGLHSHDTKRLIQVLKKLRDAGNTVVVVEHDEEIMLESDHIIDIGKEAGSNGGNLVCYGSPDEIIKGSENLDSLTADYLAEKKRIAYNPIKRAWKKFIKIEGARENNLKNIDVRFPLGIMTVITGVSGSGKSTLIRDILFKSVNRKLVNAGDAPGLFSKLSGDLDSVSGIEFVDQNPIGTSTRSNPATYLKAFDEIRKLFSEQQLAKQLGYTPGYFSFNSEGGRCEECKGEGILTIPMQFMADMQIKCEECGGKRYKKEILDIKYNGKNIYDILEMTVDQAIDFFKENEGATEKKIISKLLPLKKVGLGYIKLGQNSSSLSGGENQRVKLAYFLSDPTVKNKIFIFDEPTTGLHLHDIATLLESLNALIEKNNSVIIIEHNLDMIKSADWIIDMGPEGGEKGGEVVAEGTPSDIIKNEKSITGKCLIPKIK